jgi:hypothetical protein
MPPGLARAGHPLLLVGRAYRYDDASPNPLALWAGSRIVVILAGAFEVNGAGDELGGSWSVGDQFRKFRYQRLRSLLCISHGVLLALRIPAIHPLAA